MDVHLLWAALAGGAALFVWGAISWMALPWHNMTFSTFADEDDVVRAIEKNAPVSGVYGIPSPTCGGSAPTKEEKKAIRERAYARMKTGPTMHAVILRGGIGPMGGYMLKSILLSVLASGLAAWVLQRTAIVATLDRALFVMLVAGVGNFATLTAYWNWHGYPTKYTVVALIDAAVAWFLAGLAIAWVLPGA